MAKGSLKVTTSFTIAYFLTGTPKCSFPKPHGGATFNIQSVTGNIGDHGQRGGGCSKICQNE